MFGVAKQRGYVDNENYLLKAQIAFEKAEAERKVKEEQTAIEKQRAKEERNKLTKEKDALQKKLSRLGIFSGKRKRKIRERLVEIENQLTVINEQLKRLR